MDQTRAPDTILCETWVHNEDSGVELVLRQPPSLLGHRPMFSSDDSEYNSHSPGAYFQTIVEPLLKEYVICDGLESS